MIIRDLIAAFWASKLLLKSYYRISHSIYFWRELWYRINSCIQINGMLGACDKKGSYDRFRGVFRISWNQSQIHSYLQDEWNHQWSYLPFTVNLIAVRVLSTYIFWDEITVSFLSTGWVIPPRIISSLYSKFNRGSYYLTWLGIPKRQVFKDFHVHHCYYSIVYMVTLFLSNIWNWCFSISTCTTVVSSAFLIDFFFSRIIILILLPKLVVLSIFLIDLVWSF